MERKVAIIGAGISGLAACRYCKSKGLNPIVFESESSVGGIWRKTIRTTKLQTPKHFYQFSDFPWPPSVTEDFPAQSQVFQYLQSYAHHFDLLQHIRFGSQVESISYDGPSDAEMREWSLWGGKGDPFNTKGKWNVTVKDQQTLSTEVYQVGFVILCFGKFSNLPNIPEFPNDKGPEVFHGKVIHSSEYAAMDNTDAANLIREKKVAVVGFQKSALDIAMECSSVNGPEHPCTVVYRTKHWGIPYFLPFGIPLLYPYLNRFSELMVHKPGESLALSLLASILAPVRWGISTYIERYITSKYRLKKFDMVPEHSFLKEMNSCSIAILPEDFYNRVEKGSIKLKKSQEFCFSEEGILFDDEVKSEAVDMVILATGFKYFEKLKDIFVSPTFQSYIGSAAGLYRNCIHPRVPQLAIIGFSESISNLHTSEMSCRWLAELLDGTFNLPSIKDMEDDVEKWDKYMKDYCGKYSTKWCIGGLKIWYNDQLCKDMGWVPKRKRGFMAELFEPYSPMDYVRP
ncbi:Flavin-containing monooxygenase [Heracleum sosnowskyi]|uniref:Flavin-containing monooxygenase n=1 Tax=Heracleum sosnowskyi TaxID=360622 RepID=A0AAD8HUN0_9APIA|nr:Flavin-containing monooxygenase [Heracleum sosnowskyi]